LYRDEYYNRETADPGVTEFNIAKNRNGRTGTIKLMFQPEYTRFVAYADSSRFAAP
jgi:replicative DNA helicase